MARKKREAASDDLKRRRSRIRRAERKRQEKADRQAEGPLDMSWLIRDMTVARAHRVISGEKHRPYWLSIPHEMGDGNPPVTNFYPVTTFRTKERAYYGFLFREHREKSLFLLDDARRELTDTVRRIAPKLV